VSLEKQLTIVSKINAGLFSQLVKEREKNIELKNRARVWPYLVVVAWGVGLVGGLVIGGGA